MANTPYYTKAESDAKNQQVFKEVKQTTEAISAGEGGKSYATLADAQAVSPAPEDGTVFQVEEYVNSGYYKFDSTQSGGVKFLRKITPNVIYPARDNSYNKLDPSKAVIKYYLHTTTGQPVFQDLETKFISEFIFVKGVSFVNSIIYSNGTLWAYDKDKNAIEKVAYNGDGINGKYILPAGTEYIRLSGSNPETIYLYIDEIVQELIAYGITKESLDITDISTEIVTKARKDYVINPDTLNSLNHLDSSKYTEGFNIDTLGRTFASSSFSLTPFIYCKGKTFIETNLYWWSWIYFYDEDYNFVLKPDKDDGKFVIPSNAVYVRGALNTSDIGQEYLYIDRYIGKRFDFGVNTYNYKHLGKKLITIGDSITYQKRWQERLCDLTGMLWSADETRLGVGFVEIDGTTHEDLGNYIKSDPNITDTSTTFTDNYGATINIYSDGTKYYRKAFRMAEGGETVMPIASQSIYSRCSDSQYYNGDIIIVHAGANDRGYTNWLPTILPNNKLSDITGLANLETDNPDNVNDYEIYTSEAKLSVLGDYTAEGDTQGTDKYNSNFRACYRGMMKKIVDANPTATIICIAPHQTALYGDTYQNKVYEYVTNNVNRIIKDVADEFGCQVIDMQPLFGTYNASQWFVSDGVWIHPNAAGGLKMADYIASQL